jgi:hypothetical protein
MRAGGKFKGLANLPNANHIDVRKEIAHAAGVGERNVSAVKEILKRAHPELLRALKEGRLSINLGHQLCKLPKPVQLEQFVKHSEDRATNKVIRGAIRPPKDQQGNLDVIAILKLLLCGEGQKPGSVPVRLGRQKRTVTLVGADLPLELLSKRRLNLQ